MDAINQNSCACCDAACADDLTGAGPAGANPHRTPCQTPPLCGEVALFLVEDMDCPMEEVLIRNKLAGLTGVTGLEFNLLARTVRVGHAPTALSVITAALESLDLGAKLLDAAAQTGQTGSGSASPASAATPAPAKWMRLALAAVLAFAAEIIHLAQEGQWGGAWSGLWSGFWSGPGPVLIPALLAIALGGLSTYKKGWIALKNFNLNMNALMSFAVTGALIIGDWPEAAMVMVLFALAEVIEARALHRARSAIRELLSLAPEEAAVQQPDGTWADVPARSVPVGALARVRPGQRIALDGRVVAGQSQVNQAPITGESLPVDKAPGDPVFAGSINESGSFEYEVTAPAANSTLARIIPAVEEPRGARAPTQRFVDAFARVYTPLVFGLALCVAVLPPLLWDGAWLAWAYKALVLLVIACPCALVISTPVSIVSGLAAASRHGILVKGGMFLEQGRLLTSLALDKTGTLTHGRPAQTDFLPLGDLAPEDCLRLAVALAVRSDHPVSKAIAGANPSLAAAAPQVDEFTALPGRGARGRMDGRLWHLANHRLVEELGLCSPALEEKLFALEEQGKSVVLLLAEDRAQALFAVADTMRESTPNAIAALRHLGVRTILLSGDNPHTVRRIAAEAGVDEAHGDLLPQDKLALVETLSRTGKTGMVGDGINDAPALAKADIGFAMAAAGADAAIETADVALMDDDLRKLPLFIRLSRATHTVLVQNIAFALTVKAAFFALALTGQATMWMAVFADMGVSLLVVANGLRLLWT